MVVPSVGVVIVNWNGEEFLGPCLRSLAAQDFGGTITPLVVDNGSRDGSLALLQRDFPAVRVIRHDVNNYCAANNRGVEALDTDYVLILNTDTTLDPAAVRLLVAALAARRDATAAMPKILAPDGRLFSTGIEERDDLYWVDRDLGVPDDGRRDVAEEVFGISGCAALHRRQVWLATGGLDEDFHMYYEDVDLSLRLRADGWRLLYVPDARVTHVGHGSIKKALTSKDWLGERNRLLVLARHYRAQFAAECVRSPFFQAAPPVELRAFLPALASKLESTPEEAQLTLTLALRDAVRELAGEVEAKWGTHRNLPEILEERERWIELLLREVARLRLWRWPGRRLKDGERAFLERRRTQRDG